LRVRSARSRRSRHSAESASPRLLTLPVNMDSRHTANAILKSAGLPKQF
jgi:hypothetical protein